MSGSDPRLRRWLAALPETIDTLAAEWELDVGPEYEHGGSTARIAPVRTSDGRDLVLKVGWRHMEAEDEAEALLLWDGDAAVRCLAHRCSEDTTALLLERCQPGTQLSEALAEPEQDHVISRLLRRLWEHRPPPDGPFRSLQTLCDYWAECLEEARGQNDSLAGDALALLRELPGTAETEVVLCTDLHAGNVLAAEREPWLVIDPKPFVGDPAFDAVQHMLNCERLFSDPAGLAERMASLLELEVERVRLWLFARCAQEGARASRYREVAERLS